MKTVLLSVVVSTILAQTPTIALCQDFPVDLQSLRKQGASWLDTESSEGYTGAIYATEEGEIVFKGHLRRGRLHGRYEDYRSESNSVGGKQYEKGNYYEGQRGGSFEVYRGNGKVSEKGIYLDGVRHGPYLAYHDNLKLWIRTEYVSGSWEGFYESFDRDGSVIAEGYYKGNSQCGIWMQNGKTVKHPPC